METTITEIGDRVFRLSTYLPEVAPPAGFTMNQFLVDADEPLLFHCGPRAMFPLVAEALANIRPVESLRWISFGHIESDECGAMNQWLAAAPDAEVAFNPLGCDVSVNDLADRPPRIVAPDEILDLGDRRVRMLPTPHVPHNWEAQVLYEEVTGTLLCGDLLSQLDGRVATTEDDIVDAAITAEDAFGATGLTPSTAPTLRALADLDPKVLAIMHGSSLVGGDPAGQLRRLADVYETRLEAATPTSNWRSGDAQ